MTVNYHDGTQFVSGIPKYYDGSAFQEETTKVWDGSQWVVVHDPQQFTQVVIDDFPDATMSNRWPDAGDADWTYQSSGGIGGGQYVYSDSYESIMSQSGDGLNSYYGRGDGYLRVGMASMGGVLGDDQFFGFGCLDEDNGFSIEFNWDSDVINLIREDGGADTSLDSYTSAGLSADSFYLANVLWDDGTWGGQDGDITAEIYEYDSSAGYPYWGNLVTTLSYSYDGTPPSELANETGHTIVTQPAGANLAFSDAHKYVPQ